MKIRSKGLALYLPYDVWCVVMTASSRQSWTPRVPYVYTGTAFRIKSAEPKVRQKRCTVDTQHASEKTNGLFVVAGARASHPLHMLLYYMRADLLSRAVWLLYELAVYTRRLPSSFSNCVYSCHASDLSMLFLRSLWHRFRSRSFSVVLQQAWKYSIHLGFRKFAGICLLTSS
jgi:hypothetical protein